jgi:polysaccharide export outer membrane protein
MQISGGMREPLRFDRHLTRVVALVALLCVAACTRGSDTQPLVESTIEPYRLGTGDEVRIIVFGEEPLTREYRVSDSGNVNLPLLGPIPAVGLTANDLGESIANTMQKKGLFNNPSVSVEVTRYRPIFILGEVNKPGEYSYQPRMTVLTAVAIAGGFTYRAVVDSASIVRTTDKKAVEGLVGRQSYVEPGDVITIFERLF